VAFAHGSGTSCGRPRNEIQLENANEEKPTGEKKQINQKASLNPGFDGLFASIQRKKFLHTLVNHELEGFPRRERTPKMIQR
jgi:hypothetical protein